MEFVAKTDVGLRRSNNEDSYFAKKYSDEVSLYIVADGLGGYEGGEIASRLLTIWEQLLFLLLLFIIKYIIYLLEIVDYIISVMIEIL